MRLLLVLVLSVVIGAASVSAQQRGVFAMHIGPAPDYRMSLGLVVPERDRMMMRARIEMAPDCSWTGGAALDVTTQEIYPVPDVGAAETAEAYGESLAEVYSAKVADIGGVVSSDYRACVARVMTGRAENQLRGR